ncbi:MAG: hypothetical protein JST01_01050 [Cyanobacteria bacterium SZAS TMP-1]|nr:hypothetical protein [Cyanobacteria bacterium SZAS TMP-1]
MNRLASSNRRRITLALCVVLLALAQPTSAVATKLSAVTAGAATITLPSPDLSENDPLFSPQSVCKTDGGEDGRGRLQSMLQKARAMKGYCYDSTLTTFKGNKKIVEVGRLYFKAPNLVRFEVLKGGSRTGAVVVRQPDGKVRGQMGGAFHGLKMTLSPDSKMLKSANGFNVVQSDLESLLSDAARKIGGDLKCLAAGPASGRPALVEILESDGDVLDRIALNAQATMPAAWNIFTNNKLLSVLQFNSIEPRSDLSDSLFIIGEDPSTKSMEDSDIAYSSLIALKAASGSPRLTANTYREIQQVISEMANKVDELPMSSSTTDSQWDSGARECMLSTGVKLESLLGLLSPVEQLMGQDWKRSVDSCHLAISDMLEQVMADTPDNVKLNRTWARLRTSVINLQAVGRCIPQVM